MKVVCAAIALVVAGFALGGCGSKPAATQVPQLTTPAISDADVAKVVGETCSKCHPVARVHAYSGKGSWQTIVTRMIKQNGAKVAPQQAQMIEAYLEKTHPAKK
ncbi:MAG: hypothetical protein NTU83_08525 [Candidatus Hydrogenedentes bacterium]|nr:hypothetical protein [Candidatus Hydrogenedentota bacterium]